MPFRAQYLLTFAHGPCEHLKYTLRVLPADAGIRDTYSVLQTRFALDRYLLTPFAKRSVIARGQYGGRGSIQLTFVDITLDHHAHDSILPLLNLLRQDSRDFRLVPMILLRIPMATIHHKPLPQALLLQRRLCIPDALRIEIRALRPPSQNNKAIFIARCAHNSDQPRFRDGKEMMRMLHRTDRVDGNIKRTIRPVLKSDRKRKPRRKLPMQLTLRRPCPYRPNAQQISQELWGNGIQHLAGNRHSHIRQVDKQLPAYAQALVYPEAAVDVGVVDEALPSDRGAGFFEVGAHDDKEVGGVFGFEGEEALGVGFCGGGVVDGAGAYHD